MSAFSVDKLPKSFVNEVQSFSPPVIIVRSNVKNLDECKSWVKEYGRLTNTNWNTRTSNPSGERFVCLKKFVCHHSAFMKVAPEENSRSFSKNSFCRANVTIRVKLNTAATRNKDPYVKKGLFAVIKIIDTHNHSLNTTEALKFLPTSDCKDTFLKYFEEGMGIVESYKHHDKRLREYYRVKEEDMANRQINPPYRAVQYWYYRWRRGELKPGTGQDFIEVSGTSSKEEGKTQPKASSTSIPTESSDPIPLEPSIEIKEEPIDYDPSPSTSNAGNEEFILPHPDDSWSTSNMVAPKVKVEPQCTFSVAGLSCPSVQDSTSESEHPSKKQKFDDAVKTSIEFEGLVPVDTPVSPVHNSNELSNPGTSNEHGKDEFDVFGEYIAVKLRNMDRRSVACTQKAISDIIFEAEMGKFLNQKQNTHY